MTSPYIETYSSKHLPKYIPSKVSLEGNRKDQRNVSYALLPRRIEVMISFEKMIFSFHYPISEKKLESQLSVDDKSNFIVASSTKKLLELQFDLRKINYKNIEELLSVSETVFQQLKDLGVQEAVLKNYDLGRNFVRYFFNHIYDPKKIEDLKKENIKTG